MRREIKLKNGDDVHKLASTFQVTTRTVYNALGGKTENDLSGKIRNVALKLYEANYIKSMPNEGVVTTRTNEVINHYFYGKTDAGETMMERSLLIDTKNGNVTRYKDGKIEKTYSNISVNKLNTIIVDMCEIVNLDYSKYFKN